MNPSILHSDIQEFINSNLNSDSTSIALKGNIFSNVETKSIIEQIEAKKRCKKKLPTWYTCKNIYYPNKLNIEQTSSEITAKYKAELIWGESIIDITGGFGVDCYYFSKVFKKVTHCEINTRLSEIVKHNYKQLITNNANIISSDGLEYLKQTNNLYDWIYIDPSRRHDSKGKVFYLNDCLPNIPDNLDLIFNKSNNILIKTSPLLDISAGIKELKHVKSIHVIAVNNEVKELLWIVEKDYKSRIEIKTVNIKKDSQDLFRFYLDSEKIKDSNYSLPLTYLFEPNSAILKAGAFNILSNKLNIYKLHKHSHLYTSNKLIDFPGRIFKIEQQLPYNKKALKKLAITKANITIRNFPETVQNIRNKFKIQEGGDVFLFFTTDLNNNKIALITSKNI